MAKTLCLARTLVIVGLFVLLSACASPTSIPTVASATATTAVVVPTETPTITPTPTVAPTRTAARTQTSAPTQTRLPTSTPMPSQVDLFLAQCPTAQEVTTINAEIKITFIADPSVGTLACTAATGSVDLTPVQKRVYRILQVMKRTTFTKPLPWTDERLYDWLVHTAKGIRIRGNLQSSYCCDPDEVINIGVIKNVSALAITDHWIGTTDSNVGIYGLMDYFVNFVHETRHIQGKLHSCTKNENGTPIPGTNNMADRTIAEMGAWGAQYYLYEWLLNYSDSTFFSDPRYATVLKHDIEFARNTDFCDEPK